MSRRTAFAPPLAALAAALVAACAVGADAPSRPDMADAASENAAMSSEVMVAAANPHAVDAGLAMLAAGGSAVDAAVAVQAVLSLVEPQSSGLGGGAFMLHYDAETGVVSAYDGRERAPAGATPDMFLDGDGAPMGFLDAISGGTCVGVPGVTDMLALAHEDHGRLDWAALFDPAITLAEEGFEVSPRMSRSIEFAARLHLRGQPEARGYFFDAEGAPLAEGHLLENLAYAETLRAVADNPRALYEGGLAQDIVAAARAEPRPSSMTLEDLASYHARRVEPICRPYRGNLVCSARPPASGGVAINEILGVLERFAFSDAGADDPANWHLFVEAQRLAYADRDRYVADDENAPVPIEGLLSAGYLDARAALIDPAAAIAHATPGDPWAHEPAAAPAEPGADATSEAPGTSHFVIVDAAGDVVSMTTTVEAAFGSGRMAGGFLLNNQLTDFSFRPVDDAGRPIANAVAGSKRPRSSMSPTIVLDADGAFLFATGSPGGSSIIAYAAKTLVAVLDWGLTPQEAIDLPNVVARGDELRVEAERTSAELIEALAAMGHFVTEPRGENSGLHAVLRRPDGTLEGGADPRREGEARGLE